MENGEAFYHESVRFLDLTTSASGFMEDRHMTYYTKWALVLAVGGLLAGCVPQEKYNALKLDRDRLAEQLSAAQSAEAACRAENESLKNQLAAFLGAGTNRDQAISMLSARNAELQAQLDDLNRRYAEALGRTSAQGERLPEPLSNALKEFAAANPDIAEYDPIAGIVRFKADLTFASGDATLTPRGKEVLMRLSTIINGPQARGFEVMVAGHTDNVRVVNPETIRRGHKDNWYLSAHRAIAAGQEMMERANVNAGRVVVAGYAEQRPVASNSSEAGKARNRRVEIILLPTSIPSSGVVSTTPALRPAGVEGNK
jgi:chemotaxis protein MotB